jgi:iron(III) transport system permease protein
VELRWRDRLSRTGWSVSSVVVAAAVAVPVAMLASSVLRPNTAVWRQQWDTRLPGELVETAILLIGVGVGTIVLGTALAWLTSAYRFPGSRQLTWLLVLPLAMPSYILGFLTLAVVGFTGPIQGAWRSAFGRDAWFPDVASLPGAILAFTLVLYPYVYLIARAGLRDQAQGAYHAARVLGAGPGEAARRIVLPMIRPAMMAGGAVVMMETLTDFATVQYFGVDTVSVGVFRIWRGTFDRDAASELSTLVLAFALVVIGLERAARGRARFGQAGGAGAGFAPVTLSGFRAALATGLCSLVVLAAFAGPTVQLMVWAYREQTGARGTPLTDRYLGYLGNSLVLAAVTVLVCLVVAVLLASAQRFGRRSVTAFSNRTAAVGYAVPGPVVGIGVVLAMVGFDQLLGGVGLDLPGAIATGSFAALVYAYSIRFLTPALNAVDAGLQQVGDEVTDSARTLGATPLAVIRRVHLPLSRASLATAAVRVGVDAVKELPIVLLLRPFGFDTLPVWVYNLASESRYQQAALPSLSIIAVALVPVVVVSRQLDRHVP